MSKKWRRGYFLVSLEGFWKKFYCYGNLIYLQHLLSVAEHSLKTGALWISLQNTRQTMHIDTGHLHLTFRRNISRITIRYSNNEIISPNITLLKYHKRSSAVLSPRIIVHELTLMNSTFSRSEPCWSEELIRWREQSLPPEQGAEEEQHNTDEAGWFFKAATDGNMWPEHIWGLRMMVTWYIAIVQRDSA